MQYCVVPQGMLSVLLLASRDLFLGPQKDCFHIILIRHTKALGLSSIHSRMPLLNGRGVKQTITPYVVALMTQLLFVVKSPFAYVTANYISVDKHPMCITKLDRNELLQVSK